MLRYYFCCIKKKQQGETGEIIYQEYFVVLKKMETGEIIHIKKWRDRGDHL